MQVLSRRLPGGTAAKVNHEKPQETQCLAEIRTWYLPNTNLERYCHSMPHGVESRFVCRYLQENYFLVSQNQHETQ
jgi:hypothetical protein